MNDLKLKVRNKIYTSGSCIEDMRINNNSIIVFLGRKSSETLKNYIDSFLKDTLQSQIPQNKIICVENDN